MSICHYDVMPALSPAMPGDEDLRRIQSYVTSISQTPSVDSLPSACPKRPLVGHLVSEGLTAELFSAGENKFAGYDVLV